MAVKIAHIEKDSLAEKLGWSAGDQILKINDHTISDAIDFRFYSTDDELAVHIRTGGALLEQVVEKREDETLGVEVEEFRIKTCGDDCIFCFVDQNPAGLREALYFRDGDYRMSFLYGNYITMTNLRARDMQRIVEQRLSPLYISVHCTDDAVRKEMMGHRTQDDRLMEKLLFLRENRIEMHTQIVLVPGYNDGAVLKKTIEDLFDLNDAIESVSIVPVGLTDHRQGLKELRPVSRSHARDVVDDVHRWQRHYLAEIGRRFVYCSDELYLLSGEPFPEEEAYDGYPLMENGVGLCRDFINETAWQFQEIEADLPQPRVLILVTGELAESVLAAHIKPALMGIPNLTTNLIVAKNKLFGRSVTVSGLLNYKSMINALHGEGNGDLILLPPDCVNFEGDFLDNKPGRNSPEDLERELQTPVRVFDGDWQGVMDELRLLPS